MLAPERVVQRRAQLEVTKKSLQEEMAACDRRLQELRRQKRTFIRPQSSSDSESDAEVYPAHDPSVSQLKSDCERLSTCFAATQELNKVKVLACDVRVVNDVPDELAAAVSDSGVWREVFMQCRIVSLAFEIGFLIHRPSAGFKRQSYHAVKVSVTKAQRARELAGSVLDDCQTPAEVIQALTSYVKASQERLDTLRALADKYEENEIDIRPSEECGVRISCLDLLKCDWRLQSQVSPLQPFRHFTSIVIDYVIDESYMLQITNANKQLQNPDISVPERTHLLSQIMDACLEAYKVTNTYQNTELDPETVQQLTRRRTTLDHNSDHEEAVNHDEFNRSVVRNFGSATKSKKVPKKHVTDKTSLEQRGSNTKHVRTLGEMLTDKMSNKENLRKNNKNGKQLKSKSETGLARKTTNKTDNLKSTSHNDVARPMGPPVSPVKKSDKGSGRNIQEKAKKATQAPEKPPQMVEKSQSVPSFENMGPPISPIQKYGKAAGKVGLAKEKSKSINSHHKLRTMEDELKLGQEKDKTVKVLKTGQDKPKNLGSKPKTDQENMKIAKDKPKTAQNEPNKEKILKSSQDNPKIVKEKPLNGQNKPKNSGNNLKLDQENIKIAKYKPKTAQDKPSKEKILKSSQENLKIVKEKSIKGQDKPKNPGSNLKSDQENIKIAKDKPKTAQDKPSKEKILKLSQENLKIVKEKPMGQDKPNNVQDKPISRSDSEVGHKRRLDDIRSQTRIPTKIKAVHSEGTIQKIHRSPRNSPRLMKKLRPFGTKPTTLSKK